MKRCYLVRGWIAWLQYLVILDEDKVASCKQVDIPGFNERSSPTADRTDVEQCLIRKRYENDSFAHQYGYTYQPMTATPSLPLVSWGEHPAPPKWKPHACVFTKRRDDSDSDIETSLGPTHAGPSSPSSHEGTY